MTTLFARSGGTEVVAHQHVGTGVSNVVRRLQSGAGSARGSLAAILGCPAGSAALPSGLPRWQRGAASEAASNGSEAASLLAGAASLPRGAAPLPPATLTFERRRQPSLLCRLCAAPRSAPRAVDAVPPWAPRRRPHRLAPSAPGLLPAPRRQPPRQRSPWQTSGSSATQQRRVSLASALLLGTAATPTYAASFAHPHAPLDARTPRVPLETHGPPHTAFQDLADADPPLTVPHSACYTPAVAQIWRATAAR